MLLASVTLGTDTVNTSITKTFYFNEQRGARGELYRGACYGCMACSNGNSGEKAKVSLCTGFYRQGFWLDDIRGVITLHMPSTENSVMMHLTLHPGQCPFVSVASTLCMEGNCNQDLLS